MKRIVKLFVVASIILPLMPMDRLVVKGRAGGVLPTITPVGRGFPATRPYMRPGLPSRPSTFRPTQPGIIRPSSAFPTAVRQPFFSPTLSLPPTRTYLTSISSREPQLVNQFKNLAGAAAISKDVGKKRELDNFIEQYAGELFSEPYGPNSHYIWYDLAGDPAVLRFIIENYNIPFQNLRNIYLTLQSHPKFKDELLRSEELLKYHNYLKNLEKFALAQQGFPTGELENALLADLKNNPHLFYADDFKQLYGRISTAKSHELILPTITNVAFLSRLWSLAEKLSPELREQLLPMLYEISLEDELWKPTFEGDMWENVLKTLDLAKKISPDDNVFGEYITSIIGKIYNNEGPVYYNAYSEILKHIAEKYPEFISEEAKKDATEHFVEVLTGFAKAILDFSKVHQSIYSSIPDSIRKSESVDEYIRNIYIIEDKLPVFMNIYKILKHDAFLDLADNNMGELAGTLGKVLQKLENSIESMKLEFDHDEQAMQLINEEERNFKTFREFFNTEFARYVPKTEEMQQEEQIPKQQEEQKQSKSGLFEGFEIVRKWFERTKPSPASKRAQGQIGDDLD